MATRAATQSPEGKKPPAQQGVALERKTEFEAIISSTCTISALRRPKEPGAQVERVFRTAG